MTFLRAVIFSIAVHLVLGFCLSLVQTPPPKRSGEAFLELIEKNPEGRRRSKIFKKDKQQIVRAAPVPEELKTQERKKARFYSQDDQTVLEEQRAQESGMTANRANESSAPRPPEPPAPSIAKSSRSSAKPGLEKLIPERTFRAPGSGDIAIGGLRKQEQNSREDGSKPFPLPNFAGLAFEQGRSTVGEDLPSDIKFGSFTSLNTDRYLYYSFYARVEEMVRHRWVKYVRAVLYSYQNSNPKAPTEAWATRIEIVLDKDGNFVKGVLHDSSGLKGLDIAPVQAFREAKQIPNPPIEMIKDDGLIHLDYQFNVHFVPQTLAEQ